MITYSNKIYPIDLVLSYDVNSVDLKYLDRDLSTIRLHSNIEAETVPIKLRNDLANNEGRNNMAVAIFFMQKDITNKLAAHEALHVVSFMFDRLGIPFCDATEEAWAYLLGWVIDCIDDFKNKEGK